MTFRDFMEAALYHPDYGFYTQGPHICSPEGPFDTNVKFPAFAFALAQAVKQVDEILGEETRILEIGGGTGELGRSILNFLGGQRNYIVVDPSSGLRAKQIEAGLQAVEDLAQVPPAPSLVFANEFLDALPVHRVMGNGQGGVLEFFVDLDETGELFEIPLEPSIPALQDRLNDLNVSLGRGQVAEISLGLRPVFQKLRLIVDPGYLIFIDYGDSASNLYSFQRRNGTLRSYYRQHQIHDIFYALGEQDLTADVDFTAVIHEARAAGFDGGTLIAQGSWLNNLGIQNYTKDEKALRVINQEVEVLTRTSQLGSAFDVLIFQTKGLPAGPGIVKGTGTVKNPHRPPSFPTVSIDSIK